MKAVAAFKILSNNRGKIMHTYSTEKGLVISDEIVAGGYRVLYVRPCSDPELTIMMYVSPQLSDYVFVEGEEVEYMIGIYYLHVMKDKRMEISLTVSVGELENIKTHPISPDSRIVSNLT